LKQTSFTSASAFTPVEQPACDVFPSTPPAGEFRHITACPGCDLLLEKMEVQDGRMLVCPRCGHEILKPKKDSFNQMSALSLAAMLLFIPANFMPLLTFELFGVTEQGSIFSAMLALYKQGFLPVAIIVLCTCIIFPFLKPAMLFVFSLGILRNWPVRFLASLLRWHHHIDEWSMPEICLIGILITIIKMYHACGIRYESGFFLYIAFVVITLVGSLTMDKHHFWQLLDKKCKAKLPKDTEQSAHTTNSPASLPATAREAGFLLCRICHQLTPTTEQQNTKKRYCSLCGATLHQRIPNSISRTWAFLLTSIILVFPANFLPVMEVKRFGAPTRSTIMDGIIYFFQDGSYGIGLVILFASILVPLFKIIGLLINLNSIHFGRTTRLRHKSLMFRIIGFIGRWSMLDIFVIALLSTLVDFGFISTITAAPAATFFCGVVVSTMFAAIAFDSRLLWD
jgi:paraquat-inducible protein A